MNRYDIPTAQKSDSERPLRNPRHEQFAKLIAEGIPAVAAYSIAGYGAPGRRNHNRLLRVAAGRIEVLRREREAAARAARMPLDQLLGELESRGFTVIEDFFERNAAGIVAIRNLEMVPVEVGMALLKSLAKAFRVREGFGIRE